MTKAKHQLLMKETSFIQRKTKVGVREHLKCTIKQKLIIKIKVMEKKINVIHVLLIGMLTFLSGYFIRPFDKPISTPYTDVRSIVEATPSAVKVAKLSKVAQSRFIKPTIKAVKKEVKSVSASSLLKSDDSGSNSVSAISKESENTGTIDEEGSMCKHILLSEVIIVGKRHVQSVPNTLDPIAIASVYSTSKKKNIPDNSMRMIMVYNKVAGSSETVRCYIVLNSSYKNILNSFNSSSVDATTNLLFSQARPSLGVDAEPKARSPGTF